MTDFHPLELKVLEALKREGKLELPVEDLARSAGLDMQAATKASFWLSSKGLCEISDKPETVFVLTKRGEQVLSEGAPEKNVLHAIASGALSMEELHKLFGSEQLNAALGRLPKELVKIVSDIYKSTTEAWTGDVVWGAPKLGEVVDSYRQFMKDM